MTHGAFGSDSSSDPRPVNGPRLHRVRNSGQSVVEFALVLPVLLILVLGAADFGRVMQARVTSESAAKAGANWGASHWQNATAAMEPAYALTANPKNCGSGAGLGYPPTCNILARACAEAGGLPGYSGGTVYTGDGGDTFRACTSGTAGGVCQASSSQSNPFLNVTWVHDGVSFTPTTTATGQRPLIGDTVIVTGTYCFKTFFPGPISQLTWTSSAQYTVQP